MKHLTISLSIILICTFCIKAEIPVPLRLQVKNKITKDELSRFYITPQRIVWTSDSTEKYVLNPTVLLQDGNSQVYFGINKKALCRLIKNGNKNPAILLDFGSEIHGAIQISTSSGNNITPKIRITLGESVSEAMSNVYGNREERGGATNHHSMRDFEITLPGYGTFETGNTGYRFARIELTDTAVSEIALKEVRAVAVMRDIPYMGSFQCNDTLLNKIWLTGAYTVHLNMQDYLMDGIKRDRMVWVGDMYPEIMTINSVFGFQQIVPKSLDFVRNTTPLPQWMNGISSYSLWWLIIQHDWYMYQGDKKYLTQQKTYMKELLSYLLTKVDDAGNASLGQKGLFLDWASSKNPKAIQAGMQALMTISFSYGSEMMKIMGEKELALQCSAMALKMKRVSPDPNGSKQAAALLAIAGIISPDRADKVIITPGGTNDFSAFMGYYILQAQALAGNYSGAINNIREFWGGMLNMGATTFWEEFNLSWIKNAAPITEIVAPGKKDIHKDFGDYCYKNLRHSLCHGWSTGPTSWLTHYVLGVSPVEAGCKTVRIIPHLGDLQWVEGTFPTPYGIIKIRHDKQANGAIKSKIEAPKEIKIIRN